MLLTKKLSLPAGYALPVNRKVGETHNKKRTVATDGTVLAESNGYYEIPGCAGYLINSQGLAYSRRQSHRGKRLRGSCSDDGYPVISICDGTSKKSYWMIHRLVAEMFVHNPNPSQFHIANHTDGNKRNSAASNLEWTDIPGNAKHAREKKLIKPNVGNFKPVWEYDLEMNPVQRYDSFKAASEATGVPRSSISRCAGGFTPQTKKSNGQYCCWKMEKLVKEPGEKWVALRFPIGCDLSGQRLSDAGRLVNKHNKLRNGRMKDGYITHKFERLDQSRRRDDQVNALTVQLGLHVLVAKHFLSPPVNPNCTFVDHIDTNRSNNKVSNLRWCTHPENCNNPLTAAKHGNAVTKFLRGADGKLTEIAHYRTMAAAAASCGVVNSDRITWAVSGKLDEAYGHVWRPAPANAVFTDPPRDFVRKRQQKETQRLPLTGKPTTFKSLRAAALSLIECGETDLKKAACSVAIEQAARTRTVLYGCHWMVAGTSNPAE